MPSLNRGLASVNEAFDQGRSHSQRFYKTIGAGFHSNLWSEWGHIPGQPAANVKVGVPLQFTPLVATKNDAIYFPPIPSTSQRFLASGTFRGSATPGSMSVVIADLLGYYPIIDGDSTDTQFFDNTLTLPRYTDGVGVIASLVANVAGMTTNGVATLAFVDSDGVSRTTSFRTANTGVQGAILNNSNTTASGTGPLGIAHGGGSASKGMRSITSLTYTTPPSGVQALFLYRPLATITLNGDQFLSREKDFIYQNGMAPPRIYDGAFLNFFQLITAGSSTYFGELTFIWT